MYNQIRKKRADKMWKVVLKSAGVHLTLDGIMGRDRDEAEAGAMALVADPSNWRVLVVDQIDPKQRTTVERRITREA